MQTHVAFIRGRVPVRIRRQDTIQYLTAIIELEKREYCIYSEYKNLIELKVVKTHNLRRISTYKVSLLFESNIQLNYLLSLDKNGFIKSITVNNNQ